MNIALVLSGGTGNRAGGTTPKQYQAAAGKPMIFYCLDTFSQMEAIGHIQIVAEESWHSLIAGNIKEKPFGFSKPGATRQLSVFSGIQDLMDSFDKEDLVVIHDAARPFVSQDLVLSCIHGAAGHDGAMPVLPVKDTLYMSEDGKRISGLLDRSRIYAGQSPECFVLGSYYEANKALFPNRILNINGSTEPAVLAGLDIALVEGDEANYKITTQKDLERFREETERGNG